MENNILDTITQIKDVLPKKQRTLCNFIVLNYVEAGMMTVAELAERSGVGATTVMRLVKTLHYDSYSDFRRALLNVSLKNNASSYIGIQISCMRSGMTPLIRLKISLRRKISSSLTRLLP